MAKTRTVVTTLKCRLDQVITQRDTIAQDGTITEREVIMETPDLVSIDFDMLRLAEEVRDDVHNKE